LFAPPLQAAGFLTFISIRLLLAGRTILLTLAPLIKDALRPRRRSGAPFITG
jgi:hypothetical protein